MPKKTKKISKQAQGWITRRARMNAARFEHGTVNTVDMVPDRNVIIRDMRKALKDAPSPMVLLDSPMMPIGKKSSDDFAAEITLAARKKGGAQAVERLLEHRISTVVSDTRDEAWRIHRRIWEDEAVRRRARVIADFMAMATQYAPQITTIGSTTLTAIVDALEEAGYTKHGRHMADAPNAATDTKAVR